MELDEARLVARNIEPMMQAKLDRICMELVNLFKHGKLTPRRLEEMMADYKAARSLMVEVVALGGKTNG